jgi:hypothetical protein
MNQNTDTQTKKGRRSIGLVGTAAQADTLADHRGRTFTEESGGAVSRDENAASTAAPKDRRPLGVQLAEARRMIGYRDHTISRLIEDSEALRRRHSERLGETHKLHDLRTGELNKTIESGAKKIRELTARAEAAEDGLRIANAHIEGLKAAIVNSATVIVNVTNSITPVQATRAPSTLRSQDW